MVPYRQLDRSRWPDIYLLSFIDAPSQLSNGTRDTIGT